MHQRPQMARLSLQAWLVGTATGENFKLKLKVHSLR